MTRVFLIGKILNEFAQDPIRMFKQPWRYLIQILSWMTAAKHFWLTIYNYRKNTNLRKSTLEMLPLPASLRSDDMDVRREFLMMDAMPYGMLWRTPEPWRLPDVHWPW